MEINYLVDFQTADITADNLLMKSPTVLGFDVECSDNKISLISLCHLENGKYKIYLFQLSQLGKIPNSLIKILENETIIKTGVGTKNDGCRLLNVEIKLEGCLELSQLAAIKRLPLGLKELYGTLFPDQPSLPKVNHLGVDWNGKLTSELLDYASCDARAGLQIALKMLNVECPINIEIAYDHNFITWVKQQLIQQPRNLTNLINLAINSYKIWAKYPREERVKLAMDHLTKLPENSGIYFKELTEIFSLTPFEEKKNSQTYLLTHSDLKLISGIPVESAVSILYNSSTTFICVGPEIRKIIVENSLEKAIKDKVIRKEVGKIIIIK